MTDEPAADLRVVDRRWWAREDGGSGEPRSSKPSYVEDLERRLAEKEALLADHAAGRRQAAAEFEQTRDRLRRESAKEVEREKRLVLASFLEVVDNLDRAVAVQDDEPGRRAGSVIEGVVLVREQFLAALERHGVTRLDAAGRPFDPNLHEAIATEPVSDPAQDDAVMEVVKPGYLIDGDVLRPASVTVGKRES